jgi:hypothetical protein
LSLAERKLGKDLVLKFTGAGLLYRFRMDGLWLGPLVFGRKATQIGPGEQIYDNARAERPASRASDVSFGSDLQVPCVSTFLMSLGKREGVTRV